MVEILVVLGIVMLVTIIGMVAYVPRTTGVRTETAVSGLESFIYQCQQDAYSGKNGEACGVRFSESYYEVYSGDTYELAVTIDRVDYPSRTLMTSSNFGANPEVTFVPGSFRPTEAGTVSISDDTNSFLITVTKEGLIFYE